eukprot:g3195.t1
MEGMRSRLRSSESALYYSYILMGFADFAPWRCVLASLDYLEDTYPGKDATKWMTVAYWAPSPFVLLSVSWIPIHKWQQSIFTIGFTSSTSVLTLIPLVDLIFSNDEKGNNSILMVSLFLVVILGSTNCILDACILGSSMNLPKQYPQAYAIGLSLSAVFVSLLRLLTKGIFSGAHDGLRFGAYVFFFLCSLFCLTALLVYIFIVKSHPIVEKCNREETKNTPSEASDDQEAASLLLVNQTDDENVSCGRILWLVKAPAVMLTITMISNVFVSPGIIVDAEWKPLGDWFKLLLLLFFALSQLSGRFLYAKCTVESLAMLIMLTIVRILVMVSSVLALELVPGPILITILVSLAGISFGYHASGCYHHAQLVTRGARESLTGGSVLLIAECIGSFIGSFLTIARTEI